MGFLRASTTYGISVAALLAIFGACSAEAPAGSGKGGSKTTGSSTGTGGSGGSDPTGTGGSTGTGGPIVGSGGLGPINPGNPDAGSGGVTVDAACSAEPRVGEKKQVDLYFMMDNSGSMDMTDPGQTASRWGLLSTAIPTFLADPSNVGMMVGLDFFPEPGTDPLNPSCVITDYENPNVMIDVLPGANNSQVNAMTTAITGRTRQGGTPTTQALTGALAYAKQWQTMHPDRSINVLFLTDGEPTQCNPNTVQTAAAAAQAAATGTPPIKTYVLGVGPSTGNLDQIAASGGTTKAYIVTNGGAQALIDALTQIRKSTLTCDYKIPSSDGGLDLSKINVSTRVGPTGMTIDVLQVTDAAACMNGPGWYFDVPPPNSTKITLCPASCGPLQTTDGSQLNVLIGCATRTRPPPM